MAGNTGAAAYQRLEKPDNAITQSFQYWGGLQHDSNEKAKQRKFEADQAAAKDNDAYGEKLAPKGDEFVNVHTGFEDTDANYTQYAQDVVADYGNMSRQATALYRAGKKEEARAIEVQMAGLKSEFKNVANGQKAYSELFTGFKKSVDENKVSGQDEDTWLAMADNVSQGKVKLKYDPKTKRSYYETELVGEDGKTQTAIVPNGALVNGALRWRDKQDITGEKGFINTTLDQLGKRQFDSYSGNYKITEQKWTPEIEKAAKIRIDALLSSHDAASDILYQITGKKTPMGQPISDQDAEMVRKKLLMAIEAGYDKTTKKDFDSGKANFGLSKDKWAWTKNQAAKDYSIISLAKPVQLEANKNAFDKMPWETPEFEELYGKGNASFSVGKPFEIKGKGSLPTTVYGLALDKDDNIIAIGQQSAGSVTRSESSKTGNKKSGTTSTTSTNTPTYKDVTISEKTNPEMIGAVLTSLVKDPNGGRYQSMDEVRQHLIELRGEQSKSAPKQQVNTADPLGLFN